MKIFFFIFFDFFYFWSYNNFRNDICKKCDSKNINKHIDMKNLQIIKNFGIKSSNIARLFYCAINKSNRKNIKHIKSLNMFDTADHRKNN